MVCLLVFCLWGQGHGGTDDILARTLRQRPKCKAVLVTVHCHYCENIAVKETPQESAFATLQLQRSQAPPPFSLQLLHSLWAFVFSLFLFRFVSDVIKDGFVRLPSFNLECAVRPRQTTNTLVGTGSMSRFYSCHRRRILGVISTLFFISGQTNQDFSAQTPLGTWHRGPIKEALLLVLHTHVCRIL